MPRIRTIKPEFWEDERIGRLPITARLLFIGLISHADDEGRFRASHELIKAQVFPYDKIDVANPLRCLAEASRVVLYTSDGDRFGWIPKFRDHQKIDKPSKSKLPDPLGSVSIREASPNGREESTTDQGSRIKDQGRDQGAASPTVPEQVFAYWADRLKHPRAILDKKRRKLLEERVAEGMDLAEGRAVVDGCVRDQQSWPERVKFNGIEYLFQNRGTVEKFSAMATQVIRSKDGYYRPEDVVRPPEGLVKL